MFKRFLFLALWVPSDALGCCCRCIQDAEAQLAVEEQRRQQLQSEAAAAEQRAQTSGAAMAQLEGAKKAAAARRDFAVRNWGPVPSCLIASGCSECI